MTIASEAIYDALVDEEMFAALPRLLARGYGARSCVLHWRHQSGEADILAHSRYFTDEQLLNYAENFTSADLWTEAGAKTGFINRAWNCDDLVPASQYGRSQFYNEWIRPMGDDTFHCMGSVISTPSGQGIIGLHRGISQGQFEAADVQALGDGLVHLRRMFSIRGELIGAGRKIGELSALFNALGPPLVAIESSQKIIYANAAADELLIAGNCVRVAGGRFKAARSEDDRLLQRAIAAASHRDGATAQALTLVGAKGERYMLSFVPIRASASRRLVLISIREPVVTDSSLRLNLQQLFGLSAAEAHIACRLADGASLAEIANERRAQPSTVRTQLKSAFLKLEVRRQSELIRLVSSIPSVGRGR